MSVVAVNKDDRLVWSYTGVPTLIVESPSGIGSAALTPPGSIWPAWFDVSLDLRALEGFVVRCGPQVHRLEVTSGGDVLFEPEVSALNLQPQAARHSDEGYTVRITPGRFAEPCRELRIQWVDYYR